MGNYKTPGYHIFSRRVRLRGTITLLTGLHIGAGRTIGTSGSDLPVLKDINGSPFIPGSSLKGVLRSNTEAFLRSFQGSTKTYLTCCQVGGDENSKDPASRPCITRDEKEKLCKQKNADALIWQKSCWVCQFFGSPWIASKVHFMDLFLTSPWANELLSIRDGVAIERDSETAAPRALFDFEVVPPGNRFSLEILVENPEDYELGMLVLGFDFLNNGLALLGGGTSRGLGRVRFELDEAIEVTPNDILACLHSEESLTPSEPKLTDTTSISTPAEVILESADEGQRVVYACLKESGPLDHKGLVSAMQQQGWTKARLQMHKYANWKELFEKSIQAGIITKIDEKYYISGNISIVNQVIPEDPRTSGEEEKSRKKQEAEKKAKIWKEALYEKLKEALEGGKENV